MPKGQMPNGFFHYLIRRRRRLAATVSDESPTANTDQPLLLSLLLASLSLSD